MKKYEIKCPHCKIILQVTQNELGHRAQCPGCSGKFNLPAKPAPSQPTQTTGNPQRRHIITPAQRQAAISLAKRHAAALLFTLRQILILILKMLWAILTAPFRPKQTPATEKQLALINQLNGNPGRYLTKQQASTLISSLITNQPATPKQIKRLQNEGISPEKLQTITKNQASALITKITDAKPPTKKMISNLQEFNARIPATRQEALSTLEHLRRTSPPTTRQHRQAATYAGTIPPGYTYQQAQDHLYELEQDACPIDGQPPTKTQLNQIKKYGGNPDQAKNRWRADEYIEQLKEIIEEQKDELNDRIDAALEFEFIYPEDMNVRKPSKALMKKVLLYGDKLWGECWEDGCSDNPDANIERAIYVNSPGHLKPNRKVPKHWEKEARAIAN